MSLQLYNNYGMVFNILIFHLIILLNNFIMLKLNLKRWNEEKLFTANW